MKLSGSCHCGAVQFILESEHPYPYQYCYCSICRKTQGGAGYAINLSGDAQTLQITGKQHIAIYHAKLKDVESGTTKTSSAQRHFCSQCASALWLFSPEWPELVHPFASAIDTPLPVAPEHAHIMLGSKANWVEVKAQKNDQQFQEYPEESIAQWHARINRAH